MEHDLTLADDVVSLVPLGREHATDLAALGDPDALAYHTSAQPLTPEVALASIESLLANPGVQAFAVTSTADGGLRGITSFYEHVPSVPRVEIGHTYYGRAFWGGETNPHAKLLLLTHAFDHWACERVALRCDADNARSAAAIQRLGARPEGVLRAHRRRHDGTVADTSYFSILRGEWPAVRKGLEERTAR